MRGGRGADAAPRGEGRCRRLQEPGVARVGLVRHEQLHVPCSGCAVDAEHPDVPAEIENAQRAGKQRPDALGRPVGAAAEDLKEDVEVAAPMPDVHAGGRSPGACSHPPVAAPGGPARGRAIARRAWSGAPRRTALFSRIEVDTAPVQWGVGCVDKFSGGSLCRRGRHGPPGPCRPPRLPSSQARDGRVHVRRDLGGSEGTVVNPDLVQAAGEPLRQTLLPPKRRAPVLFWSVPQPRGSRPGFR